MSLADGCLMDDPRHTQQVKQIGLGSILAGTYTYSCGTHPLWILLSLQTTRMQIPLKPQAKG
jgi:hypothetical protein